MFTLWKEQVIRGRRRKWLSLTFGRHIEVFFTLISIWTTILFNATSLIFIKTGAFEWVEEKSGFLQRLYFSIYHIHYNVHYFLANNLREKNSGLQCFHMKTDSIFIIPIKATNCSFSVFLSHQGLHFAKAAFAVRVEFCALLRTFWTFIQLKPCGYK
jgi:hypothetical protein